MPRDINHRLRRAAAWCRWHERTGCWPVSPGMVRSDKVLYGNSNMLTNEDNRSIFMGWTIAPLRAVVTNDVDVKRIRPTITEIVPVPGERETQGQRARRHRSHMKGARREKLSFLNSRSDGSALRNYGQCGTSRGERQLPAGTTTSSGQLQNGLPGIDSPIALPGSDTSPIRVMPLELGLDGVLVEPYEIDGSSAVHAKSAAKRRPRCTTIAMPDHSMSAGFVRPTTSRPTEESEHQQPECQMIDSGIKNGGVRNPTSRAGRVPQSRDEDRP